MVCHFRFDKRKWALSSKLAKYRTVGLSSGISFLPAMAIRAVKAKEKFTDLLVLPCMFDILLFRTNSDQY